MRRRAKAVGLFDAKTHLYELIERVEQGEEIAITKRGATVARLVPPEDQRRQDPRQATARIRQLRRGIKLKGVTIRSLIEEGRF